jgi:hypothetical protein
MDEDPEEVEVEAKWMENAADDEMDDQDGDREEAKKMR